VPSHLIHAQLGHELPAELAVGGGTALFVDGWCFCPTAQITNLTILANGRSQPLMAQGMPRRDVFRAYHPGLEPGAAARTAPSWTSGFWGLVEITPDGDACELELRAELEDGGETMVVLGRISIVDRCAPVDVVEPGPSTEPFVAICMATYEPPPDLFARQLDSIRAQSHRNWVCLISDDCSSSDRFAELHRLVGDDPRFIVSRSPRRQGFYLNFELALSMTPAQARYVALADQDDHWHADKLERLLAAIDGAQLVYSDARIVSRTGESIAETYWTERRNNHEDLLSVLVANSVTGAASLFQRDLLDDALPFPPAQFSHFHDHWIALTALARGEIAFVEEPLYEYVQHGAASLGHAAANRLTALGDRLASLRRDPRERARLWRRHYFVDVCRLLQIATVLEMRCGGRMAPDKRKVLERFRHTDRSLAALTALGMRGAHDLFGAHETLGAEWMLMYAFGWRRLSAAAGRRWVPSRFRLDASPPAVLTPKPDRGPPASTAPGMVAEKIAPLELSIADGAPPRVNLLIPTIDLEHFFGGYIAKFNLARRLAERGVRVRILTVDPVGALPHDWRRRLESYSGLAGAFAKIEVVFGRESGLVEVSRADRFIATTWWTAHIARSALHSLGRERFLYLIQEYEPFTFPMGSHAALAEESYTFRHSALFSTELLRDYFRCHAIGVYRDGAQSGDRSSASFQNAITAIEPPNADELARRDGDRRLLFYSRPEAHAARNMFELGVLALARALDSGAFARGWTLNGIGTLESGHRVALGGAANLNLLSRAEQHAYAGVLRRHDVGLALMYTPHPSLVPIEMASAGMLTVTNSFENKTPERMSEISSNLITTEPTIESVAAGLVEAASAADDLHRRVEGSTVHWSRNWNDSFDDELLVRIESLLDG
jgi:glycosyltransferase involved in cell wall biosynthesis